MFGHLVPPLELDPDSQTPEHNLPPSDDANSSNYDEFGEEDELEAIREAKEEKAHWEDKPTDPEEVAMPTSYEMVRWERNATRALE
jgi:hypothetical protein